MLQRGARIRVPITGTAALKRLNAEMADCAEAIDESRTERDLVRIMEMVARSLETVPLTGNTTGARVRSPPFRRCVVQRPTTDRNAIPFEVLVWRGYGNDSERVWPRSRWQVRVLPIPP